MVKNVYRKIFITFFLLNCLLLPSIVHANQWQRVIGQEALTSIFNNTTIRGIALPNNDLELNKIHTEYDIEYCQDGTGELTFWGQVIPRTWRIKGNDQACIRTDLGERCYYFEQHTQYGYLYRAGLVGSKQMPWGVIVSYDNPSLCNKIK
jgi:hypothetical protein